MGPWLPLIRWLPSARSSRWLLEKADTERRRQGVPQESALAALSDRNRCTPLRFEQSILQKIVVPTCPVPSFPLPPLLQKAERLE